MALSVLCLGTVKHDCYLLKTRRSDYVASKFLKHWLQVYGSPKVIVHDQGGEFEGAFVALLEQFSISSRVTGAHAPWQLAVGERHGSMLGQALQAIVSEQGIEGYKGMKEALSCACMAKNATVTRDGFTPHQRVFGTECTWPSMTEEEPGLSFVEALDSNTEAARAHRMRLIARVAFIRQDVKDKMRRTILRKPHTSQGPFLPGTQVYFWTPTLNRARYRPGGQWRGPGTILVREQQKRYFVSWRGRLLLLAEENLRLATKEEPTLTEPVREEMVDLQGVLRDPMRDNSYEDMRGARPPPARPRKRPRPVEPETEERKKARQMLRGSKSVARLMKQGGMKMQRKLVKKKGKKEAPAAKRKEEQKEKILPPAERVEEELQAPEMSMEAAPGTPDTFSYTPSVAPDAPDERMEEVEAPPQAEDPVDPPMDEEEKLEELRSRMMAPPPAASEARPPEAHEVPVPDEDSDLDELEQAALEQMGEIQRRQVVTDDVPHQLKRKLEAEEDEDEPPEKKVKINAAWVVQALAGVVTPGPANEWVTRYEIETLRKLTGLPITAARLHRKPRKRLQKPPKLVGRARVSILIGKDPADSYVVEETADEVGRNPRRKAPFTWTGMTLFVKPTEKVKEHPTYVEMSDGIYEVKLPRKERREFEKQWTEEVKDCLVTEVLLLKLKASGRELDPKAFDQKEQEEFRKSDAKEWSQWIENKVVRQVTKEEAEKIPRWQIFRSPLRMIRVNKTGGLLLPLVAKSRLVVPGHLDPEIGSFRTDAPTTNGVATKIAKSIAAMRGWSIWSFDVTTAFLSGEATSRQIFVKAPPEGLPGVKGHPPVEGGALFQILKSAYGLTEAPRLWYLKATKSIGTSPLKELPIAKATYAAADEKGTWAILCLHVDDGLLMGDEKDPRFVKLKKSFDKLFTIKTWQQVPMTFLGVDMEWEGDLLTDTMESYIRNIEIPELEAKDPGAALGEQDLTRYRQLVMRLRWPAQQVMPQLLYETSSLAQRVSQATVKDFKDAVKLYHKMVEEANQGRARLRYPRVTGEPCLVTYFDASLGKEKDGKSQLGHIHFFTNKEVQKGPQAATVVDFGTIAGPGEWSAPAWLLRATACRSLRIGICTAACWWRCSFME